ncbi:MAG: alanine racemase [Spirochaetaceae bacterium]
MRATRAIVHLDIFRENLKLIRDWLAAESGATGDGAARPGAAYHRGGGRQSAAGTPKICLAVKADAYGHGIGPIARVAIDEGVEYLAVAAVDEAVALREEGISAPLLLYSLPIREEIRAILDYGVTPLVSDVDFVADLSEAAELRSQRTGEPAEPLAVHLKIDTGMGRIGCRPEDAAELARTIEAAPRLQLEGVSTHFPNADDPDQTFTNAQIERFIGAVDSIRAAGIDPGLIHAANSAGLLEHPGSRLDMVRPGLLAYGYYSTDTQERHLPVRPVMELESRIVYLKSVPPGTPISYGSTYRTRERTWIATIPVGYGDGYSRLLSNNGDVLVEESATGRRVRAPIAGRVCMDQLMLDLGPDTRARRYDRVVLFGPDPTGPDAAELARRTQTIPYEITCNISKRVPRVYREPSTVGARAAATEERPRSETTEPGPGYRVVSGRPTVPRD